MSLNNEEISNRIKNIRLSLGLTMEEFGNRLNTSKGAVNNWEKGKSLPNKERLKNIAEIGNLSVNELLYGSIEDYILNEINIFFNNQEGIEFSPEGKKEVVKDALQQSLKNPLINATFGEESQKNIFVSFIHDEINKAVLRRLNLTDFTNNGFVRFTLIELSDVKDQLKGYLDNGVNEELYEETISIINKASNDIKDLKGKYNN